VYGRECKGGSVRKGACKKTNKEGARRGAVITRGKYEEGSASVREVQGITMNECEEKCMYGRQAHGGMDKENI
jgi:hypothetical protein